jgi:hypothetical protein
MAEQWTIKVKIASDLEQRCCCESVSTCFTSIINQINLLYPGGLGGLGGLGILGILGILGQAWTTMPLTARKAPSGNLVMTLRCRSRVMRAQAAQSAFHHSSSGGRFQMIPALVELAELDPISTIDEVGACLYCCSFAFMSHTMSSKLVQRAGTPIRVKWTITFFYCFFRHFLVQRCVIYQYLTRSQSQNTAIWAPLNWQLCRTHTNTVSSADMSFLHTSSFCICCFLHACM